MASKRKHIWIYAAVVGALIIGAIAVGRFRKVHAGCKELPVDTYDLQFDTDSQLTISRIVNSQTGLEVSGNGLQSHVRNELRDDLFKISNSHRWGMVSGRAKASVTGCSEPYLVSITDYKVPQVDALMSAAEWWDLPAIRKILATGVNVNARDSSGHTALMYAASDPQKEILNHPEYASKLPSRPDIGALKYLIDSGANPNDVDDLGLTTLMLADSSTAPLLLSSGANLDARDNHQRTALMYAAQKTSVELLRLFLAHGADVNAKDSQGESALMYAVRASWQSGVDLLLRAGADRNLRNNLGDSAVTIARKSAQTDPNMREILDQLQRR